MGYIGEIYNPFRIFSRDFIIRPPTADGYLEGPVAQSVASMGAKDWYRISGTLCQPAMWCFLPCGDCAKVCGGAVLWWVVQQRVAALPPVVTPARSPCRRLSCAAPACVSLTLSGDL